MKRLALAAGLAWVCAVGFAARFYATWGGARDGGDYVISFDSDPYYHLRRLEWLARNGRPLVQDAFAAAPATLECPWPVALEYAALGLDAAVFHGERGRDSRLLAAGFLPVIVGLVTLIAAFFALARATGAAGAALGGAAVLAVWPSAVHVSSFFAFDHHCLELLAFVLVPAAATWAAASPNAATWAAASSDARPRLGRSVMVALIGATLFGVAVLCGDGALLALAALGAALGAAAWRRDPAGRLLAFTGGGLVGLWAAAVVEWAAHLPRLLSPSGRIGIGTALVGLALIVRARARDGGGTSDGGGAIAARVEWRVGVPLVATGCVVAASAVIVGARYLTAADAISANIAEALPLWRRAPAPTVAAHVAAAAAALWLGARSLRRRVERPRFFAIFAAAGALLGLLQTKYVFLFGLTVPWLVATALAHAHAHAHAQAPAPTQGHAPPSRRALAFALAAAVVAFVAWRTRAQMIAAPTHVSPADAAFAAVARAAALKTPPQDAFRPDARPAWTIALDPSVGPRALWLSERAVTSIPFWGAPALATQFSTSLAALLAPEDEARPLLDRLHARYVLATDLGPSLPWALAASGARDAGPRALYRRLLDGTADRTRFRLVATAGAGTDRVALYERLE
jgi:hypothetical protein